MPKEHNAKLAEAGALLKSSAGRAPTDEQRATRLIYEVLCSAASVEPYSEAPAAEAPEPTIVKS